MWAGGEWGEGSLNLRSGAWVDASMTYDLIHGAWGPPLNLNPEA